MNTHFSANSVSERKRTEKAQAPESTCSSLFQAGIPTIIALIPFPCTASRQCNGKARHHKMSNTVSTEISQYWRAPESQTSSIFVLVYFSLIWEHPWSPSSQVTYQLSNWVFFPDLPFTCSSAQDRDHCLLPISLGPNTRQLCWLILSNARQTLESTNGQTKTPSAFVGLLCCKGNLAHEQPFNT